MGELVALHTQYLREPLASRYVDLAVRVIQAARLNTTYPDRRRLQSTLVALRDGIHHNLYDGLYIDARSGLPNLASFTRIVTDRSVAADALGRMEDAVTLAARRHEAELFDRLADKRRYYEALVRLEPAPVDEHRVLLRRHDFARETAWFRIELTKIVGSGSYLRVTIELAQTAGPWSRKVVDLDARGEVASGTENLQALVYRLAAYDAETLFVRLHELDGVTVERVQRGIIGPLYCLLSRDKEPWRVLEPANDALGDEWQRWLAADRPSTTQVLATFASDVAAIDVRDERSNDPLQHLLSAGIVDHERARYASLRARHPFRVYKDRKFVVTPDARQVVESICRQAGTRNVIHVMTEPP